MSDIVLRILQRTPVIALLHQVTCCVLCVGLSALAVGLGARLPNLRETSPAKIAAGFGGTLNLILGALFVVMVTLATAVPCCFWVISHNRQVTTNLHSLDLAMRMHVGGAQSVLVGLALTLLLGVGVTVAALRTGFRAFRHLEF